MAIDPANRVSYFFSLPSAHKDYLGAIRHWDNLRIGFEDATIWVKDISPVQVDSLEIKTIPHKTIYYANGPSLYKQGSLLPERTLPSVLWTPIERGLSVQLPSFNHDYFGLQEKIEVSLLPTGEEQEAFACLVQMDVLQAYIETASAVRLQRIQWVIVDQKAFLLGTPLLPIQGDVYWRQQDFLFPAGYQLEFPLLADTLFSILNPHGNHWIVWEPGGQYWKLAKEEMRPLSISSFRESVNF